MTVWWGLAGLLGLLGCCGLLRSHRANGAIDDDPLARYPVAREPATPNADAAHTPLMTPAITPEMLAGGVGEPRPDGAVPESGTIAGEIPAPRPEEMPAVRQEVPAAAPMGEQPAMYQEALTAAPAGELSAVHREVPMAVPAQEQPAVRQEAPAAAPAALPRHYAAPATPGSSTPAPAQEPAEPAAPHTAVSSGPKHALGPADVPAIPQARSEPAAHRRAAETVAPPAETPSGRGSGLGGLVHRLLGRN
ncbi:hypothetical protein [Amycolatopsis sp. CA-128772]|uniref:hypothetical protein n=1 Tax=Amycolatopsis sp. CA-128772 TaxID=2073159 RepID=UPI000CD0B2A6|nr:hypothetical protein [Amycolatopsis sp. CA-128772]